MHVLTLKKCLAEDQNQLVKAMIKSHWIIQVQIPL